MGRRRGSDPTLLWLWCRPSATVPITHIVGLYALLHFAETVIKRVLLVETFHETCLSIMNTKCSGLRAPSTSDRTMRAGKSPSVLFKGP